MSGMMVALGPCWLCKRTFEFHPDLVVSVQIDPLTGSPPDVDPQPGGYDRAVRMPLCPDCCARVNQQGRQPPLDERDSLDVAREMWP